MTTHWALVILGLFLVGRMFQAELKKEHSKKTTTHWALVILGLFLVGHISQAEFNKEPSRPLGSWAYSQNLVANQFLRCTQLSTGDRTIYHGYESKIVNL